MKKALSLILAVAMCVALLPTFAFAADASDTPSYTYNFGYGSHDYSKGVDENGDKKSAFNIRYQLSNVYSDFTEAWAGHTYHTTSVTGSTYAGQPTDADYYWWFVQIPEGYGLAYAPGMTQPENTKAAAITFKVKVGKAGTYTPSLTLATSASSVEWDVFLTKESDFLSAGTSADSYSSQIDNIDATYRLGSIDAYSQAEGEVTETYLDRTLEAGIYYLTFIATGKNDSWTAETYSNKDGAHLLLKSLTLSNTAAVAEPLNYITTTASLTDTSKTYLAGDTGGGKNILSYSALNDTTEDFAFMAQRYTNANPTIDSDGVSFELMTKTRYYTPSNPSARTLKNSTWIIAKISVPEAKKYQVSFLNTKYAETGAYAGVYICSAADAPTLYDAYCTANNILATYGTSSTLDACADLTVTATGNPGSKLTDAVMYIFSQISASGYHDSRVAHDGTAPLFTLDAKTAGDYYILFQADDTSFAANTNYVNTDYQNFYLSGIKLTPVEEETEDPLADEKAAYAALESAKNAAVTYTTGSAASVATAPIALAAYLNDGTLEKSDLITANDDGSVTAGSEDGYTFLYWSRGLTSGTNGKIVSFEPTITPKGFVGENSFYIAVYESVSGSQTPVARFYNMNGELVANLKAENGSVTAPALPSLPGYGKAMNWSTNGKDSFTANESLTITKDIVYVAQYGEPEQYTITVNGVEGTYLYGDRVRASATERKNGTGFEVFNYWTKTVGEETEIVSFDNDYTFYAYEDCTLTPVYNAYKPGLAEKFYKIMLKTITTKGENVLMAEFIGFDSASVLEKGVVFGNTVSDKRLPMMSDATQLAIITDETPTTGYAILSDGTVIYDK